MVSYNSTIGKEERETKAYLQLTFSKFGKRTKIISFLCTLVGVCSVYLSFISLKMHGRNISDIIMGAVALVFIYLGFFGIEQYQKKSFMKKVKIDDEQKTLCSYVIDHKGLTMIKDNKEEHFNWDYFHKWAEHGHYIYITTKDKKNDEILLIDMNKITKSEKKELTTYLKAHLK